MHTIVQVPW